MEHFVSSVPSATLLPEEMPDACGGTALQLLFRGCGMRDLPSLKQTAKAPENGWLEYSFPFGMAYFQVLC